MSAPSRPTTWSWWPGRFQSARRRRQLGQDPGPLVDLDDEEAEDAELGGVAIPAPRGGIGRDVLPAASPTTAGGPSTSSALPGLSVLAYRPGFFYEYVHAEDCRCPDASDYARDGKSANDAPSSSNALVAGSGGVTTDEMMMVDGSHAINIPALSNTSAVAAAAENDKGAAASSSFEPPPLSPPPSPPTSHHIMLTIPEPAVHRGPSPSSPASLTPPQPASNPICAWEGDWDGMLCPLCASVFDNARVLGCCGVEVCYNCIHHWIKHRRSSKCPFCRHAVSEWDLLIANDKQARVDALEVRCAFSSLGCPWTGPRIALKRHVLKCIVGAGCLHAEKSNPELVAFDIDPPHCQHPYCVEAAFHERSSAILSLASARALWSGGSSNGAGVANRVTGRRGVTVLNDDLGSRGRMTLSYVVLPIVVVAIVAILLVAIISIIIINSFGGGRGG
ncbi:hypothetical protein HK101_007302 [Irineochytrium annulatum]|nr:hypothetical protein HK101_007302 [Irineochytrium annulatum]